MAKQEQHVSWVFDPWRTFLMLASPHYEHSEGAITMHRDESLLSQYNQLVVNPCCGPDTLKRARASSLQQNSTTTSEFEDSLLNGSEQASILTSTTIDESVSTSSIQSFVTPKQEEETPRASERIMPVHRHPPPRPRRRRVCLLKDCRCSYHQALERSIGPIDVDSFCEEKTADDNKTVITSILEDLDESFRLHRNKDISSKRSIASGETSVSSDSDPAWQVRVTVTSRRKAADDDTESLAESKSSHVSVPVDVDDYYPGEESIVDEFVLDERELSRELVGYMEGFEPEVISQYSALDVIRWEAEQYEDDAGTYVSSPEKSKGSADRKSHASTFYPYSIPESAAEV